MQSFKFLLIPVLLLYSITIKAQSCPNIGQNPLSAFPVCGTSTFFQASVPICNGQTVPAPGCNDPLYEDKNPYYYKFTCFQAGTLFFTIDPNTNSDDYDWSLYDVTGQNPTAIYTNPALTIASNWSGDGGNTGMSNNGNNQYVCGGLGRPRWTRPSNLIVGHNYLLMISHFTNSQSGYALSFGGGTAVITDPTPPNLLKATPDCDGKSIKVKLNKKMLCSSLAANGSDFYITPGNINVTAATTINCSTNFDTDALVLNLSATLPAGNYILHVKNGTDNNTMLDYCSKQIPLTDIANFNFTPATPTPIDSIAPPTCAPASVTLIFANKQIKCSSIAADGSDFAIAGNYPVSILNATPGACVNGITEQITLTFNRILYQKGTFTITLKLGSDGNTIVDECDQISIIGSSKKFSVKDTVNADFTYIKKLGCVRDTIETFHTVANEENSWQWYSDNVLQNQNTPNASFIYTVFGIKNIKLISSNGFCTDTATQAVDLDNYIKADFETYEDNCPKEPVKFTSKAIGKNLLYTWQFGDGGFSNDTNAVHTYFDFGTDKTYNVLFTITNNLGCTSSITKPVNVLKVCGEFIPTAFTPNGDGTNDTFGPLYAVKANDLIFRVFNRWGQKVFETNNWRQPWNGKIKGVDAPTGAYVWSMQYINRDDKKPYQAKGTVVLIR
jgi:gliding motility-associated-like protein